MDQEQVRYGVLLFCSLILSLSVHEAAHAFTAHLLGDDTAKRHGRLTLNPMAHLDQLGTLMIALIAFAGMGFGWAKPVPVDPLNFKSRSRDVGIVSFAGPLSNFLQAILAYWAWLFFQGYSGAGFSLASDMCEALVKVNLSLAAFNLLPIYPLDGQKVLSALLPGPLSRQFDFQSLRMGAWPLLIVIVWEWVMPIPGPLSLLMGPVVGGILHLVQISAFWVG